MKRHQKGFTLVELVLVIAILGILAVVALPQFMDVSTKANEASRDGVVGAVRSGITLWRANDLVNNGPPGDYPTQLDNSAAGATAGAGDLFFEDVLNEGISETTWKKDAGNANTYIFNDADSYTYDPLTGVFAGPTPVAPPAPPAP